MQLPDKTRRRSGFFGWWYVSLGAGFLLLGVNRLVVGAAWWQAALRWGIAAGFFELGYFELKRRKK
jgi:hypothetical protein